MDESYLIVRINNKKNIELHCFFFNNVKFRYNYPTCFTIYFEQLNDCFYLLSLCYCFNILSTPHKLYVGMEIFKAYLAVKLSQSYIQE
uniref:Uncharacterized protein n=1 Tax=Palisada sp. TaxID=1955416 RepID=A0A1Z1MS16_9FLOR|nr:hypothetical protein [Palisada sp.]